MKPILETGSTLYLIALVTGCASTTSTTPDSTIAPVNDELIVYVARADGGETGEPEPTGDIYTMKPDGTNVVRLTTTADNAFPAWSQDGKQIAFDSLRSGHQQIWVMGADGSNPRQVSQHGGKTPSWSSDGKTIVFWVLRENSPGQPPSADAWVIHADGTEPKQLGPAMLPSFSPDGKSIAFMRGIDGTNREIFSMNADGSNVRQLTLPTDPDSPDGNAPAWSPDGKKIAFFCGHDSSPDPTNYGSRAPSPQQVCVMDADGANRLQLTHCDVCASDNPAWSANGKQIIFDRGWLDAPPDGGTYIIDLDGTHERKLLPLSYGGGRLPWRSAR